VHPVRPKNRAQFDIPVRSRIVRVDGGRVRERAFVADAFFERVGLVVGAVVVWGERPALLLRDFFAFDAGVGGVGFGDEGFEGVGGHSVRFGEIGVLVFLLPSMGFVGFVVVGGGGSGRSFSAAAFGLEVGGGMLS